MAVLEDTRVEEKLELAILHGAKLLVDNGLGDWKIKLNNRRTSLAETWHSRKTITYSKHFLIVADKDQLEGVTLHEVTHALLGPGHGHGETFVKKCIEISPDADYAKRSTNVPIRKYLLTCPECGYAGSHNVHKELFCGLCFKEGKKIAFEIKLNKLEVRMW